MKERSSKALNLLEVPRFLSVGVPRLVSEEVPRFGSGREVTLEFSTHFLLVCAFGCRNMRDYGMEKFFSCAHVTRIMSVGE